MEANVHPSKATAVNYGLFVQAAYDMYDANPTNLNPPAKNIPPGYDLVLTIQMTASDNTEFIGFFARSQAANENSWVAAFRGTRTLTDASVDADYYLVPFDNKKPNEMVPRGACDFYRTLSVMPRGQRAASPLAEALSGMGATPQNATLVATGHSLGAWLATLYAFDRADFNPSIFTFASPKAGNQDFVTAFDNVVRRSYRIANVQDEVTKLPSDARYKHVNGEWPIDGGGKVKVGVCQHYLGTYLYLLSNDQKYLDSNCAARGMDSRVAGESAQ